MSDEKIITLVEATLDIYDKRIEELEASDKDTNEAFANVSVKFIELEKSRTIIVDTITNINDSIAELRKQIECVFLTTEELNAKHLNNKKELNEPKCDDGSPLYPDIRDMYYSKKLGLIEPREDDKEILNVLKPIKAGNTIILDVGDKVILPREDEPNNIVEIICANCGDITLKVLENEVVVKREDLQFLIKTWELSDMKKMYNYPRFKGIKEAYGIQ